MNGSRRHRWREWEYVALREDRPNLEIMAGDPGVIEVLYYMIPPHYEVTFICRDGRSFGMVCSEDELTNVPPDVEIPPELHRPA